MSEFRRRCCLKKKFMDGRKHTRQTMTKRPITSSPWAFSQGCNTFLCNVMQTNQGPDMLCQAKSHVQTACESHDLKMDFCCFKQLPVTNSYGRIMIHLSLSLRPGKSHAHLPLKMSLFSTPLWHFHTTTRWKLFVSYYYKTKNMFCL